MKEYEKEALLGYVEFLLVKQLLEPIVEKTGDVDIIGASYDAVYVILNELERSISNQEIDNLVDKAVKKQ